MAPQDAPIDSEAYAYQMSTRNLTPEMLHALEVTQDPEFIHANDTVNSAFGGLSQYELENIDHSEMLARLQQMIQGLNQCTIKLNRPDLFIQLPEGFAYLSKEQYVEIDAQISSQIGQITSLFPKHILLFEAAQEAMKTQAMADSMTMQMDMQQAQTQAILSLQQQQIQSQPAYGMSQTDTTIDPTPQAMAQQFLQQQSAPQRQKTKRGFMKKIVKGIFSVAKSAQPHPSQIQYKCLMCKRIQTYSTYPGMVECCGRGMFRII